MYKAQNFRAWRFRSLNYIFHATAIQQRLGLHLAVISLTSPIKGRDTQLLAKDFFQFIQKKQERWIKPLKKKDESQLIAKIGNVDWDVPGHRQIKEMSQVRDIIKWSQKLGLIDEKKKNMWTPLGAVLSKIIEQDQKKAFLATNNHTNPLKLTIKQKIFFLYLLLLKDGDFLLRFSTRLPKKIFSANDVVECYYDAWKEIANSLLSSKEYKYMSEGRDLSRSINDLQKSSVYLRVQSKLENLTDLSILTRAEERNYQYNPGISKLEALNRISSIIISNNPKQSEDHWRSFFGSEFFLFASEIFNINGLQNVSEKLLVSHILNAYHKLVGGLGLCRISEISLLAGIEGLLDDPPVVIETTAIKDTLYDMNKQYRKLVSLHVDMLGNISYVKIDKSLLSQLI